MKKGDSLKPVFFLFMNIMLKRKSYLWNIIYIK